MRPLCPLCGAEMHLEAGHLLQDEDVWAWLRCDNGHATEADVTPFVWPTANPGSRAVAF